MSLNKLTDGAVKKEWMNINANTVNCSNLTTEGDTIIGGNNYATPDLGQPNYSLHTDGAGQTFWSPDDTGSGDITYDGVLPTTAGQLLKFSGVDGKTAQQSLIVENGGNVDLGGQNVSNVALVDGVDVSALQGTVTGHTVQINLNTSAISAKVSKAGDTMSGNLDMGGNNLENVNLINGSPVGDGDFKADGSVPMTGDLQLNGNNMNGINILQGGTNPFITMNNPAKPDNLEFYNSAGASYISDGGSTTIRSASSGNQINVNTSNISLFAPSIIGSNSEMTSIKSIKSSVLSPDLELISSSNDRKVIITPNEVKINNSNLDLDENNIDNVRQIVSSTSNNNKIILNSGINDAFAIGDNSNARFSFNSAGLNTVTRLRGPIGPLNFDVDNSECKIENGNLNMDNNNIENVNNTETNSINNSSGDLLINDSSGTERIRISASGTNRVRIQQGTNLMVENITSFNAGGNAIDIKQSGFSGGNAIYARFEDATTDSRFRTVRPLADNLYNMGSQAERWNNIYFQNLNPVSTGQALAIGNTTDRVDVNTSEVRFNGGVVSASYIPNVVMRVIADEAFSAGSILTQSLTTDFRVVRVGSGDADDTTVIGFALDASAGAGSEVRIAGARIVTAQMDGVVGVGRRGPIEKSDTTTGRVQSSLASPGTVGCSAETVGINATVNIWLKNNESF